MKKLGNTFNRFSLDQKVITLIAIEVVVFCVITWVAYTQVKTVGNEIRQINYVTTPLSDSIRNMQARIDLLHLNVQMISARDFQYNTPYTINSVYQTVVISYQKNLKGLSAEFERFKVFIRKPDAQQSEQVNVLALYTDGLLEKLSNLTAAVQNHRSTLARQFKVMNSPKQTISAIDIAKIKAVDVLLQENLFALISEFKSMRQGANKNAIYVERIAIGFIVLSSIAAFMFFIITLLLIVRKNISKPLQLLTDTINAFTALHQVDESEFEKVLMQRGDELGRLSRSFNRLKYDLWSQGQDLHDAKDEAEKANRAKTDFLAAASHDLRQPLHAMQMYIAALREKSDNPEASEIIDNIDAVSVSTARLLSALLDVSQLESGAIKPQFEDFAIQDLLRRIYRSFSPAAKQKKLDFRLIPCSATVTSDPVLLERILGNFMSNSIRYTHTGRVLIGCRLRGDFISVEVWDTGIGIPEHETLAIFEDFHQIDNLERDRSKGLGLGLGIAQRLSDCLNHKIEYSSNLGKGSRFSVLVAKGKPPLNKTLEVIQREQSPWGLSDVCVLLIEDDKEVLQATQQLLISWGCKVYLGRHLEDVMRVIEEPDISIPDIIIADMRLPGDINGMEVSTRVQLVLGRAIPTVMVTGDVEANHIRDIADQGYRVLTKPVQPAKLRALISHLVHP
ncbi:MAG: signal transduction histidine kinase [Gammaproteobacteria bacterium]|jgi:signal transduction histidine kinase